jgi:hypothetical protein
MLGGFRQPKTKDKMKTNDELITSAPNLANTMLSASASSSSDEQVSNVVRRKRCVLETVVIGDGTPKNPIREQYSIFSKGELLHKFDSSERYSLFELKNYQRGISSS